MSPTWQWPKQGVRRIQWRTARCRWLASIRERFAAEKPLAGQRLAACLHVTSEPNLVRTLQPPAAKCGCARPTRCRPGRRRRGAGRPLRRVGVRRQGRGQCELLHATSGRASRCSRRSRWTTAPISSRRSCSSRAASSTGPPRGAAVRRGARAAGAGAAHRGVLGSTEETRPRDRLAPMGARRVLRFPVIAVNDSPPSTVRHRYGTGQSNARRHLRATTC